MLFLSPAVVFFHVPMEAAVVAVVAVVGHCDWVQAVVGSVGGPTTNTRSTCRLQTIHCYTYAQATESYQQG